MITNPRRLAVEKARAWWAEAPVYLDTETTGITEVDVVIELAVIDRQGSRLLDTLVHTSRPISRRAREIHGITLSMLEDAPSWAEVADQLNSAVDSRAVVMYNARFDLKMIAQTNQQHWITRNPLAGCEIYDLMELYAQFRGERRPGRPGYRWVSLEKARAQCGIPLPNAHRAGDDALLTRAVHRWLTEA